MRLIRTVLFGLCAFALPFAASAEDKGFYVGAGGGANFQRDSDIDGSGSSASADMKTGWAAAVSGGYRYGNGWRTELELSHRRNNADKVNDVDTNGSANATSGMVNLLYGLKTGTKWTPYAGVGVGAARVKFNEVGTNATNSIDGSDVKFAYQGIAGFGYRVTEEAELFADYRYMGTLDVGANNMRLSMRRAQSVKNELMRLGVPEKDIVMVAKGETEPLVQTNDGVREPQNRRVLIEFQ